MSVFIPNPLANKLAEHEAAPAYTLARAAESTGLHIGAR